MIVMNIDYPYYYYEKTGAGKKPNRPTGFSVAMHIKSYII